MEPLTASERRRAAAPPEIHRPKPRATRPMAPNIYAMVGMARTWAKDQRIQGLETDEDYYDMLQARYGVRSLKLVPKAKQQEVLDYFRTLGWGAGRSQPSTDSWKRSPLWLKARAIWHALAKGGEVRTNTDEALLAYVKRQTGVDHWRWLNPRQCHQIIEALKKWADRKNVALNVDG
jgi:hypothetical protein